MKAIIGTALVLATALLSGCAEPTKTWYREGATQRDFYMDQGQCKAQGLSFMGGNLLQAAMIYNVCMQGKGWVLVSSSS